MSTTFIAFLLTGTGQVYEPCLALDLDPTEQATIELAYGRMADAPGIKIMLSTYFGEVGNNLDLALALPVAGLHLDLVRRPEQLLPISRCPPQESGVVPRSDRQPQHLERRHGSDRQAGRLGLADA